MQTRRQFHGFPANSAVPAGADGHIARLRHFLRCGGFPAEKEYIFIRPEGKPVLVDTKIHSFHLSGIFQCQHIAALLMHAHKIISRHVKKGVMAGKNNRFGHHHPMRRQKAMLFYRLDGRMLVNFQMGSDYPQKVQGVETRLSVKADRSADRKRSSVRLVKFASMPNLLAACASRTRGSSSRVEYK